MFHALTATFDRTYEGLKLDLPDPGDGAFRAFDRTYEGLKQDPQEQVGLAAHLLTVPMRV